MIWKGSFARNELLPGGNPGIFDWGSHVFPLLLKPFTQRSHVWGRHGRVWDGLGALPSNGGCLGAGGLLQNKVRFQALKSAFWWILEMILLWTMVKAKNLQV